MNLFSCFNPHAYIAWIKDLSNSVALAKKPLNLDVSSLDLPYHDLGVGPSLKVLDLAEDDLEGFTFHTIPHLIS